MEIRSTPAHRPRYDPVAAPSKDPTTPPDHPVIVLPPDGGHPQGPTPQTLHRVRFVVGGALAGASAGFYTGLTLLPLPGLTLGLALGGMVLGGIVGRLAAG